MIQLSEGSIMVLRGDGSSAPFDSDELQSRIIKSCLSSGVKDAWIAEDISLSVEHALVSQAGDGSRTVEASELDRIVARILDETGYHEVAEDFRSGAEARKDGDAGQAHVAGVLSLRLGLSGEDLESVSKLVAASLSSLGVREGCSPELILELARHYRRSLAKGLSMSLPGAGFKCGDGPWLVEGSRIAAGLSPEARLMISPPALSMHGVSRLFPSLRVDIRLSELAASMGLLKPLTELALMPGFRRASLAIDEICVCADRLCASSGRKDAAPLPLWINLADASMFLREWMDCESGVDEAGFGLASSVASMLSRRPFKLTCR